jgi:hypothetical protein
MKRTVLFAILTIASLFIRCDAQYEKMLDFNGANGARPQGQLLLVGGKLYGTKWQ